MAGNAAVQLVGAQKIVKKVDDLLTLTQTRQIVSAVGPLVHAQFLGQFPTSWSTPSKTSVRKGRPAYLSQVRYQETTNSARITAPIIPEIFFERGSERGTGRKGKRTGQHKRKTTAQFKAGNNFIKARRYQARTRAYARKLLKQEAQKLAEKAAGVWSA